MTEEHRELDIILSRAWHGWDLMYPDMVKQPGYRPEMDALLKDAFIGGVMSCHAVLLEGISLSPPYWNRRETRDD
jgi:hypothetical protein